MSQIRCRTCDRVFEASRLACCPDCLAERWLSTPELVRQKHDPRELGDRREQYRSIVTPRVIQDLRAVLEFAAAAGSWYRDADTGMLVHLTPLPLGRAPGVGIPAGRREPEHALDCLFIAEADSAQNAHIFAADGSRHEAQVRAGVFLPLDACAHPGCPNLALPIHPACADHASEELAGWPGAATVRNAGRPGGRDPRADGRVASGRPAHPTRPTHQ